MGFGLARAFPNAPVLSRKRTMTWSFYLEGVEFKPIPQAPGYLASQDGRILSVRSRNYQNEPPHLLALMPTLGYRLVTPMVNGVVTRLHVHVAVLSAWRRLPRPGEQGRHLNGVRHDNRLINLAWGTPLDNGSDTRRHGSLKGRRNPAVKLTEDDVIRLRTERRYKSLKQLRMENPQWSKATIWAAVTGFTWPHLPGAVPGGRRCVKEWYKQPKTQLTI